MKTKLIILSILLIVILIQVTVGKDYTKLLPQENISSIIKNGNSVPVNWKDFNINNGQWFLSFDKHTGQPTTAFGKPIKIKDFNFIDSGNIELAVNTYLQNNRNLFNINPNSLSRRKLVKVKNTWAISFAQLFNGIEVLNTNVEFKIRDDGKIISFSIKYYNDINIQSAKLISPTQAQSSAIQGMSIKASNNTLQSDSKSYILPLLYGEKTKFALVNKYLVIENSSSKWISYVDVNTGDLLWRKPMILDAVSKIENNIKKSSPEDEETIVPLTDCSVTYNGNSTLTDKNGEFVADLVEGQAYSFGFAGPWCFVDLKYTSVPNSIIFGTIKNEDLGGLKISATNDNSKLDERYLFYYTNEAHDFYKETDPESKAMDFQCNVFTTYQGSPNASSDLTTGNIIFSATNNPTTRFVETPSVLFHEYGHSQNQRLYYEVGVGQGMVNLSCHEAMADLNSALILNESKIGLGAWLNNPNKFIRDIDNHNQYPKNISSDSHVTGLILAGAYWDLVKVLSIDTVRYIAHFTKKLGTPDDENVGIAFGEWFFETLTTDDVLYGDADLSNGTPHFKQILTAFNNHRIGTNLLMLNSFFHVQHEDTQDTTNDYIINFDLGTQLSFFESKPQNVKLVYFINDLNKPVETDAIEISPLKWQAKIPAQPRGTTIYYYMKATEPVTEINLNLFSNVNDDKFLFLVGYSAALFLDFNNNDGKWTVGNSLDNTQSGIWEWGTPQTYYHYYQYFGSTYPLQSNGDYHPEGQPSGKCWVTGASNGGDSTKIFGSYIPQGRTTLESPVYNTSDLNNPIIDYWRWFTSIVTQSYARWVVQISNDGGLSWIQADSTIESEDYIWSNHRIYLSKYFKELNTLKMKFIFYGLPANLCISEGAIDDFKVLSGNDAIINSVDDVSSLRISSYPNPVNSNITLNYNSTYSAPAEIAIYNIMGEKLADLYKGYINQGNFSQKYDLSNYSTGVYFIRINLNNETSCMRIIKQ